MDKGVVLLKQSAVQLLVFHVCINTHNKQTNTTNNGAKTHALTHTHMCTHTNTHMCDKVDSFNDYWSQRRLFDT